MKMRKLPKTQALAAAVSLLLSAGAANAGPVATWDYVIDSGFTTVSWTTGTGVTQGDNDNAYWSAPSTLSWGPAPSHDEQGGPDYLTARSGIDIGGIDFNQIPLAARPNPGNFAGSINTGGVPQNTVLFTHFNRAIPLSSAVLATGILSDQIVLTPTAGSAYIGAPDLVPPALTFDIDFTETNNNGPHPSDIFVADVAGAGFVYDAVDDIWKIVQSGIIYPDLETLDPNDYWVYSAEILVDGLYTLTDEECGLAGVANNCIGLTTPEDADSNFQIALAITADRYVNPPEVVPEPSTLALMGLGLAGLGFRRRFKSA